VSERPRLRPGSSLLRLNPAYTVSRTNSPEVPRSHTTLTASYLSNSTEVPRSLPATTLASYLPTSPELPRCYPSYRPSYRRPHSPPRSPEAPLPHLALASDCPKRPCSPPLLPEVPLSLLLGNDPFEEYLA
jgi:hypothetical protein